MQFSESPFDPFTLTLPRTEPIALVCDSPHSGTTYPTDFNSQLPISLLRSGEDTYVDELWSSIPDTGGVLLAANFPRTYIDPNRNVSDIDPDMLAEPWPHELQPTAKSLQLGHGLIWRNVRDQAIYDHKLWVADIEGRIDSYYQPYHDALNAQIESAFKRFSCVWHMNLHSMPSNSYESLGIASGHPLADFVLGDRDGTTCDPAFMAVIENFLTEAGYSVRRNDPFKGVALIERIGQPEKQRNSVQIEINRALYMNEKTYEKTAGFDRLKASLDGLSAHVATFIRDRG